MHWMTFEYLGGNFHCGRPWHPYGIPYALPDCSSIEGPQGAGAPTQNFLNFGNPASPHDTSGYPKLTAWSSGNLTYEGTYWRWIERAWLGGLRLMVMSVNENRVLCELQANRKTNCDEMDTVRRGFEDIRELQRYVDAQAGGPGKGFFQIVTDPLQARRVINAGKMAVVLEIEVSEPFGCRGWETSTCDRAQVDRELDEMYRLGRALVAPPQQGRQPADGRALRQRSDRRAHQRRQQAERRLVLERARPARARWPTTRSRRSRRRAARSWTARSGRWASRAARSPPIRRPRTATRAG